MSAGPEVLGRDKESLLLRSAVCRLRLRRDMHALRASLDWKRGILAAATAPSLRQLAFGVGLSIVGAGRAARLMLLAGRVVLAVKIARAVHAYALRRSPPAACAIEQTQAGIVRSLGDSPRSPT